MHHACAAYTRTGIVKTSSEQVKVIALIAKREILCHVSRGILTTTTTLDINFLCTHIYRWLSPHAAAKKALSGPLTPQMSPCRERPQTAPWVRAAPSSWPIVWNWQGLTQAFMAECARSHVQTTTLLKVMEVCQQLVPVSRHSGDSRPKVTTCTYMFSTHLELCSI